MKAFLDIRPFWPSDESGEPRSVNSVYEQFKGTPFELNRNTLSLALAGRLDRVKVVNQVKLAAIASALSGKTVSVSDLIKTEE